MSDKYSNFSELESAESPAAFNVICENRESNITIIAPHGGKIERWTSEIATEIAGEDYNLYCFEGKKQNNNFQDLHITSTNFDEPQGREVVKSSNIVIAIHGCHGNKPKVFFGGLDQALIEQLYDSFRNANFNVGKHKNPSLRGTSRRNICNLGARNCGVQLEISSGLRATLSQETIDLANFVAAIRGVLDK